MSGKTTFKVVGKIKNGVYGCYGCGIEKNLIAFELPNLCDQDLVLCPSCVKKLRNTLGLLAGQKSCEEGGGDG